MKKGILSELYLRDNEEAYQIGVKFTVYKVRDKSRFTMLGKEIQVAEDLNVRIRFELMAPQNFQYNKFLSFSC